MTDHVVSLSAQNQTNIPVTFGQVFKSGDVAKGKTLTATIGGKSVSLQVDAKAINPDGSLRHAVLTALVPSLAGKASESLTISTASSSTSGAAITLAQVLATKYDAKASFNIGGKAYTADARTLLQAANSAKACKPWGKQCNVWLSGSLVSEWIVGGPVKDAQGKTNPNLQVYFNVRAYAGIAPGSIAYVRTDIVVENTWAYTTAAVVQYTANLASGSASYTSPALKQYNSTRWHRELWWNGAQPAVYLQQNTQYLQASLAVPRYENLTPGEKFLSSLGQSCPPLAICDQTRTMGDEGAQDAIGPLPRWTSVYLIDPDVRAYNWMLANTDALGAYSIHFRDDATAFPLSIVKHPYATEASWAGAYRISRNDPTQRGKDYLADLLATACSAKPGNNNCQGYGTGNPNVWDNAHQPAEGYVPYMVTGSYYYEQEVAFGASHNEVWTDPTARGFSQGLIDQGHGQVRGVAWSLREIVNAAYILPDSDPLKTEFNQDVKNSIKDLNANYTNNPKANPLHAAETLEMVTVQHAVGNDYHDRISPWQNAFLSWSAGHAAELGFAGADAFRDWLAKLDIGFLTNPDYCWIMASFYSPTVVDSSGHWLTSFAAMYKATFPTLVGVQCNSPAYFQAIAKLSKDGTFPTQVGEMWGYAHSATGFPANLQIGVAAAADSNLPNAHKAWEVFDARTVKPIAPKAYNEYPQFAVLPRYVPGNGSGSAGSTSGGSSSPSGSGASDGASGSTPPPTSSGSGGTGSTPPTSSGATSTPPPTTAKGDQPPAGVSPGPADPRGAVSADCAALKTCTLSVEKEGPFTDPAISVDGWQSAQYARLGNGRNCILFSFSALMAFDNSVRCLDPATGKFTYVTKNTEYNKDYVDGNGIIARDNQMMLAIPSVGVLVHGGAYWNATRASNWDGFFDYKLMKWTYISNIYDLFVPPDGFLTDGDGGRENWSAMNPAVAWSEQDDIGFVYGGDNHGGGPGNYITLVHPRKDGRFDLQSITPPADTMSCTFLRNSAVAVGDWAYVVGGRCAPDSTHSRVYDSAAFRRFNLVTHKWQMLNSLPDNLRMPVVTYDSRSGYIVVYSGNGGSGSNQGDPGYWVGHNSVYIWNVDTQGPWIDITSLANMPAMFQAAGAYDPVSGWHCYRPGKLFDANGKEIASSIQKSQVWCMRLDFSPKK